MTDPWGATESASHSARDAAAVHAGELVAGKYRLEARLGGGGMAEVWRARHEDLGARVALKFPHGGGTPAERDALLERFRFEVQTSAQLAARTDGVVAVRDLGVHHGHPFAVMDLIEGRSLDAQLMALGPLDAGEVAVLLEEVGRALDAAHAVGIIHRDIKPANVLLADAPAPGTPRARLADFGVAKAVATVLALDAPRTTAEGALVGSPAYMSPEQILGQPITAASDLWALGALAYEALTGRLPFDPFEDDTRPRAGVSAPVPLRPRGPAARSHAAPLGSSGARLLVAICEHAPTPLTRARPELPPALDAWLERALHKDPTTRFSSAGELARAFRSALTAPLAKPRRRFVATAAATLGITGALAALLVVLVTRPGSADVDRAASAGAPSGGVSSNDPSSRAVPPGGSDDLAIAGTVTAVSAPAGEAPPAPDAREPAPNGSPPAPGRPGLGSSARNPAPSARTAAPSSAVDATGASAATTTTTGASLATTSASSRPPPKPYDKSEEQ